MKNVKMICAQLSGETGARLYLLKSHIPTYTKKDGTVVNAHDDKRTKKLPSKVSVTTGAKVMQTMYEVYFGNGEENPELYPTRYFQTKNEAIDFTKEQVLHDEYTVVKFKTPSTQIEILNGQMKQHDREIVLTTVKPRRL